MSSQKLGNDIDASYTKNWHDGKGFEPIGTVSQPFTGSLDGQGYQIDGLTIIRPDEQYVGLLNMNDASIRHLTFKNVTVTGGLNLETNTDIPDDALRYSLTGALAGFAITSAIEDVHVKEAQLEGNDVTGTLAGYTHQTNVQSITIDGFAVKSEMAAGGLYGYDGGITDVSNINIQNGSVQATYAAGGMSGNVASSTIEEIDVKEITVIVTGEPLQAYNYAGGLFGYEGNIFGRHKSIIRDVTVTDSHITGVYGAGGLATNIEETALSHIHVEDVSVRANEYAGGLFSYDGGKSQINNSTVQASHIQADEYAGGMAAQLYETTVETVKVDNVQVEAGGLFAYDWENSHVKNSIVQQATVQSQTYAGGMTARLKNSTIENGTVEDSTVEGGVMTGGLFAFDMGKSLIKDSTVQRVNLTGVDVGGMATEVNETTVQGVTINDATIQASVDAGGFILFDMGKSHLTDSDIQNSRIQSAKRTAGFATYLKQTTVERITLTGVIVDSNQYASGFVVHDLQNSLISDIQLQTITVTSQQTASGVIQDAQLSTFQRLQVDQLHVTGKQSASGFITGALTSHFEDMTGTRVTVQGEGTIHSIIPTDRGGNTMTNVAIIP